MIPITTSNTLSVASFAGIQVVILTSGSNLMDLPGVGPIVAVFVLADVGDVTFTDRKPSASGVPSRSAIEAAPSAGFAARLAIAPAGSGKTTAMRAPLRQSLSN